MHTRSYQLTIHISIERVMKALVNPDNGVAQLPLLHSAEFVSALFKSKGWSRCDSIVASKVLVGQR